MASGLGSPNGAGFFAGLCPPKFDVTKSSFALSKSSAVVDVPVTVTATLHNTNNDPLTNALVNVTATNVRGDGQVLIDGDRSSESTNGSASYTVTTDANGVAQFTVSGSEPGPIDVVVNYESQTIDAATVQVTAGSKVTTNVPGRATIARLSSLVGGLISWCARRRNGGSAITSYQYSLNGGTHVDRVGERHHVDHAWDISRRARAYRVTVRAINANGPGAASTAKTIVTRT